MKPTSVLTVEQVKKKFEEIELLYNETTDTWDSEAAHVIEDEMHLMIIDAIFYKMCEDPIECCRLVKLVQSFGFQRYYG